MTRAAHGLAITAEVQGTSTVLRLAGELDLLSADALLQAVQTVLREHRPHRLVLDLAKLTFVDSYGLAVFVSVQQLMNHRGRQLRLMHPLPQVAKVLRLTGLDRRLKITFSTGAHDG